MKRSDMLDILWDVIADFDKRRCDSILARQVLDKVEELGMLPPFNIHSYRMDGDNADSKSITYRTWELEESQPDERD